MSGPNAATRRAALEAAILLGAAGLALAAAHRWHGALDAGLAPLNDRLTPVNLWLLFVAHVLLAAILIVRGPANWLERSLLRFVTAKVIVWGWFAWPAVGRSETALTIVLTLVGLTSVELVARAAWRYLLSPDPDPPATADCWRLLDEHAAEIDRLRGEVARLGGEAVG